MQKIGTCGECLFLYIVEFLARDGKRIDHTEFQCRRFPPNEKGIYSQTAPENWCGLWVQLQVQKK